MLLLSFVVFVAYCVERVYSGNDEITLWQFGTNRLLDGDFTQPLRPIGIASDGLSTTYLYEVLDIKADDGTTTDINTLSRTIVASASGWDENVSDAVTIHCKFVAQKSGLCFDSQSHTASGAPTPVTFSITTELGGPAPAPAAAPSNPIIPTDPSFPSNLSPTASVPEPTISSPSSTQRISAGAIAGCATGGFVVLCLGILLVWLILRRRRQRSRSGALEWGHSSEVSKNSIECNVSALPNNSHPLPPLTPIRSSYSGSIAESFHTQMSRYHFEDAILLRNQGQNTEKKLRPKQQGSRSELTGAASREEALQRRIDKLLERLRKLEARKANH
ncbi:hypothetical protein GYMLUDRAFT_44756 [Collybiopsis luxurians FD-317 M1]|uniref:Mid2 domain-containing protein n=1 Tax=Collybiopsis luxurians FD-317 M1 TaxID=944289 RepID=A0A0D0BUA2_9AGAR|nr:hypothetical protein GYMLUDRAFT_44756 [Collybiopsis luxurians FD-317 M1]